MTKLDDFEDPATPEDRFREYQTVCRQLDHDERALFWRSVLAQDKELLGFVRADRLPRRGNGS